MGAAPVGQLPVSLLLKLCGLRHALLHQQFLVLRQHVLRTLDRSLLVYPLERAGPDVPGRQLLGLDQALTTINRPPLSSSAKGDCNFTMRSGIQSIFGTVSRTSGRTQQCRESLVFSAFSGFRLICRFCRIRQKKYMYIFVIENK